MLLSTPSRTPSGPPRRTVLHRIAGLCAAGTAAGLLTGCSDSGSPDARAEDDPALRRLRERTARDSSALLEQYDATLAAHPALQERLRPLRDEVARHARAFGGKTAGRPAGSASASPSPSGSSGSPGSGAPKRAAGPDVPGDEGKALSQLAAAERRLADARAAALLDAPPEAARLLASVAAAGAAHAYLLTEGS